MEFDWAGSLPRAEVTGFLGRARQRLSDYADLDQYLGGALGRADDEIAEQVSRYQEPFRLVIVGEFNVGKSALINAILGRPGFLQEGKVPTTGSSTEIWWGDTESGEVLTPDDQRIFAGDVATAIKYTYQQSAEGASLAHHGGRIILRVPVPLLRNLVIIDTPGLGASARDDEVTRKALRLSDAAIVVISALRPGGEDTLQLAEWLRKNRRRVMLAVTWLDQAEDPAEALSTATELLASVTEGGPVRVIPPEIHKDLAALAAAERRQDAAALAAAREQLAAHGYSELIERVQGDFAYGNAGFARRQAAMTSAAGLFRRLSAAARARAAAEEEPLAALQEEVSDLARQLDTILPKTKVFLAGKIDEAVDVRVGEFIAALGDAVELFIDKLAAGKLRATARALRTFTPGGSKKVAAQIRRDFIDLFPERLLHYAVEDIDRAVSAQLQSGWGSAAGELDVLVPGHEFSMESVSRGVIEHIGVASAAVLVRGMAWLGALVVPGGLIFDIAVIVLSLSARRNPGKSAARRLELQKREARQRIRTHREDLVHRLGDEYRGANRAICETLTAVASADQTSRAGERDEIMARVRRLGEAAADLTRLEADANGLAGQGDA
jgi:hypothetical protein